MGTFKTHNGYGFLDVPNKFIQRGKNKFWINNVNAVRYIEFEHKGGEFPVYQSSKAIQLPPGQWSILGLAKDLKENDWENIVEVAIHMEDFEHMVKDGWWNYEKPKDGSDHGKPFDTATASGLSLLKSLGLKDNVLILKQQ